MKSSTIDDKIKYSLCVIFYLLIWQIISMWIGEEILLVSPVKVLSTLSKPDNSDEYSIGNAIINEITIDRFLLETQINTTITIDATGVAFIADTKGFIIILKLLKL